jgi:hypothetical protein
VRGGQLECLRRARAYKIRGIGLCFHDQGVGCSVVTVTVSVTMSVTVTVSVTMSVTVAMTMVVMMSKSTNEAEYVVAMTMTMTHLYKTCFTIGGHRLCWNDRSCLDSRHKQSQCQNSAKTYEQLIHVISSELKLLDVLRSRSCSSRARGPGAAQYGKRASNLPAISPVT